MSILSLEERVAELEAQVTQMRAELRCVKEGRPKDWRRTIGAFTDDEEVNGILQEAMRLREKDREKARSTSSTSQRKTS
jgi:hypothetical protein